MTLREWLKAKNITQSEFAAKIGRTQSRVSQILANGTTSVSEAFDIERETDGAVTAASFAKTEPA